MLIAQSQLTKLPPHPPSQLPALPRPFIRFFRGGPAPAVVVAGARRSGRATRPSNRITDPDNAEASSSATTHKHKASGSMAAGRINHKIAVDDEGSTDGSEIDDYEPDVAEHPATTSHDKAGRTRGRYRSRLRIY
jgi:hypothetical protein